MNEIVCRCKKKTEVHETLLFVRTGKENHSRSTALSVHTSCTSWLAVWPGVYEEQWARAGLRRPVRARATSTNSLRHVVGRVSVPTSTYTLLRARPVDLSRSRAPAACRPALTPQPPARAFLLSPLRARRVAGDGTKGLAPPTHARPRASPSFFLPPFPRPSSIAIPFSPSPIIIGLPTC
jgi:hypothetical protein